MSKQQLEGHDQVQSTLVEVLNFKHFTLSLDDQRVDEFKQMVCRAVNTWDEAPKWVHDLADMLTGTPKPRGRPSK